MGTLVSRCCVPGEITRSPWPMLIVFNLKTQKKSKSFKLKNFADYTYRPSVICRLRTTLAQTITLFVQNLNFNCALPLFVVFPVSFYIPEKLYVWQYLVNMDNHSDLEYLQSKAGKQALMDTHVEGLIDFLST